MGAHEGILMSERVELKVRVSPEEEKWFSDLRYRAGRISLQDALYQAMMDWAEKHSGDSPRPGRTKAEIQLHAKLHQVLKFGETSHLKAINAVFDCVVKPPGEVVPAATKAIAREKAG
jgi:hypothetical protein